MAPEFIILGIARFLPWLIYLYQKNGSKNSWLDWHCGHPDCLAALISLDRGGTVVNFR